MQVVRTEFELARAPGQLRPMPARLARAVDIDEHLAGGTLRNFEARSHVFTEGDAKNFVYNVVTGAVCLYKILPDGRRQVFDFAFPGDLIGLGFGHVEVFNAQATKATRVKCLPVALLRKAASEDARVALKLCDALMKELTALREHLVSVGQRTATERLVTFLLTLSRRNEAKGGDPTTISLPMTRYDIGDFLGMTIETVSRTFTKLKAARVIASDHSSTIRLTDIDRLQTMANAR